MRYETVSETVSVKLSDRENEIERGCCFLIQTIAVDKQSQVASPHRVDSSRYKPPGMMHTAVLLQDVKPCGSDHAHKGLH